MILERTSTVDELAEALTDLILGGGLPPGVRLREAEFASRFDVSRNTLREALHRLARDGLVVHRPHRGVTVARPAPEDVRDIFRVRRTLEKAGLRGAAAACAVDLSEIAARMDDAADRGDWGRLVDLDIRFHSRLVAELASPRLDTFFAGLFRELRLSFMLIDSRSGKFETPSHVPDHARMAEVVGSGRIDDAAVLLEDHLRAAELLVLRHLEESCLSKDGTRS